MILGTKLWLWEQKNYGCENKSMVVGIKQMFIGTKNIWLWEQRPTVVGTNVWLWEAKKNG
jgi:hypothetical protein